MDKSRIILLSGLACSCLAIVVISILGFSEQKPVHPEDKLSLRSEDYRIYTIPLPTKLDFAGEQVPLEKYDVYERLDREFLVNTYWHSNALLWMKRANRWFPVIENILESRGIPDDFKYLALVESNLTQEKSPRQAVGFWQFLEETARSYGLEVNDEVDERYNVERSTEAACSYLMKAYEKFGEWSMAAASYNMGIAGLQEQADKQKQYSYWDLLLNDETSRYVCRIVAAKSILNQADDYGFVIRPSELYAPLEFDIVTIDHSVDDFTSFAANYGMTYKEFKILNPWLRQSYLRNKQSKTYQIKVHKQS